MLVVGMCRKVRLVCSFLFRFFVGGGNELWVCVSRNSREWPVQAVLKRPFDPEARVIFFPRWGEFLKRKKGEKERKKGEKREKKGGEKRGKREKGS